MVKVELNRAGVRALLQSAEMEGVIRQHANEVQARAGDGYKAEVRVGQKRVYANVKADTARAYFDNLAHNTLLKALGGE